MRTSGKPPPSRGRISASGFTYVELLLAVAMVGIGICAAMAGVRMGMDTSHTASAMGLARHFAYAIQQFSEDLEFSEPSGGNNFGPEEGLISNYDDVDDLDGLNQCPPIDSDGVAYTGYDEWRQKVVVNKIDSTTLGLFDEVGAETVAVKITVTIERGIQVVGEYQWLVVDR